jgi:hypothetical protein
MGRKDRTIPEMWAAEGREAREPTAREIHEIQRYGRPPYRPGRGELALAVLELLASAGGRGGKRLPSSAARQRRMRQLPLFPGLPYKAIPPYYTSLEGPRTAKVGEPGYVYHGTSWDNLPSILREGIIRPMESEWEAWTPRMRPTWKGQPTDRLEARAVEPRTYASTRPNIAATFGPYLLRMPSKFYRTRGPVREESEVFRRSPLPIKHVEYLTSKGTWRPLTDLQKERRLPKPSKNKLDRRWVSRFSRPVGGRPKEDE